MALRQALRHWSPRAALAADGADPEQCRIVTAPAAVLALDQVSRILAGRRVVRDLSFTLGRGEVLGLLGVNGAGKSTTLRMIAGVLAPSAGMVRLDGEDLYERPELARRRIGYLPEVAPLHTELTVEEFLVFCARLRGLAGGARAAAARAIERCELGDVRRRLIGALSKGFRQRVGLAQAILHDPELIVLDEPASGLDPVQALRLRELVRGLGADHAVVLSTHVLPDVLACCDRVAILHEGELRHEGALAAFGQDGALRVRVTRALAADDWLGLPMVVAADPIDAADARRWRLRLREGASAGALAAAIVERSWGLEELRAESSALEEIFMAIAAGAPPAVAA
jgi:gliding motility-associated transport system ATP-binding protein